MFVVQIITRVDKRQEDGDIKFPQACEGRLNLNVECNSSSSINNVHVN
jgi:hypothetical protein